MFDASCLARLLYPVTANQSTAFILIRRQSTVDLIPRANKLDNVGPSVFLTVNELIKPDRLFQVGQHRREPNLGPALFGTLYRAL